MGWNLPERIKRLSLSSYRYTQLNFQHMQVKVAEQEGEVVGVAAWETDTEALGDKQQGLLLHGLYVHPQHQHNGIGSRLCRAAKQAVNEYGYDGMLVRAQADADGFFLSQGMQRLPIEDPHRHYANRFWLPVDQSAPD